MTVDRRTLLKGLATAGVVTAAAPGTARASTRPQAPADAFGMLYDATLCIGCKACMVACKEANGMPPESEGWAKGLYDAPTALSGKTLNIIKLYNSDGERSYMKAQCMHCLDPACTRACMIGALQKRERGVVTWEANRCIGCRYCQVACPYEVPKFQWDSANPKIAKCEMCHHRFAEGKGPACAEVCPRHAVIAGPYTDLITEAKARLAASPNRYVPKIYGLDDGGGTQVLYLSHVDFDKLGLPDLGDEPSGIEAQHVQHTVYQGFVAPVVLYGLLGAVLWRNRRGSGSGKEES